MNVVTPEMNRAIECVRARARSSALRWEPQIARVPGALALIEALEERGRIAIHFHPERLAADNRSVVEGLLDSGVFKTQWETGISTGSPSAFVGGARHVWEERLFDRAYEHAPPHLRPRYGALRLWGHPDGPAPRFGSCYFILATDLLGRSTFTYPGSQEPEAVDQTATADMLAPVLGPLFEALERDGSGLGIAGLDAETLVSRALEVLGAEWNVSPDAPVGGALDSFVEVQIHGPIRLREDVVGVVADPAFRGTSVERGIERLCTQWNLELQWHRGFSMDVADVPETFRGWSTGALARRIALDGRVDARVIGEAANHYENAPEDWPEFDSRDDALTAFRRIWHALVLASGQA